MHWQCTKSGVGRVAFPPQGLPDKALYLPLVGPVRSHIRFWLGTSLLKKSILQLCWMSIKNQSVCPEFSLQVCFEKQARFWPWRLGRAGHQGPTLTLRLLSTQTPYAICFLTSPQQLTPPPTPSTTRGFVQLQATETQFKLACTTKEVLILRN